MRVHGWAQKECHVRQYRNPNVPEHSIGRSGARNPKRCHRGAVGRERRPTGQCGRHCGHRGPGEVCMRGLRLVPNPKKVLLPGSSSVYSNPSSPEVSGVGGVLDRMAFPGTSSCFPSGLYRQQMARHGDLGGSIVVPLSCHKAVRCDHRWKGASCAAEVSLPHLTVWSGSVDAFTGLCLLLMTAPKAAHKKRACALSVPII